MWEKREVREGENADILVCACCPGRPLAPVSLKVHSEVNRALLCESPRGNASPVLLDIYVRISERATLKI